MKRQETESLFEDIKKNKLREAKEREEREKQKNGSSRINFLNQGLSDEDLNTDWDTKLENLQKELKKTLSEREKTKKIDNKEDTNKASGLTEITEEKKNNELNEKSEIKTEKAKKVEHPVKTTKENKQLKPNQPNKPNQSVKNNVKPGQNKANPNKPAQTKVNSKNKPPQKQNNTKPKPKPVESTTKGIMYSAKKAEDIAGKSDTDNVLRVLEAIKAENPETIFPYSGTQAENLLKKVKPEDLIGKTIKKI